MLTLLVMKQTGFKRAFHFKINCFNCLVKPNTRERIHLEQLADVNSLIDQCLLC